MTLEGFGLVCTVGTALMGLGLLALRQVVFFWFGRPAVRAVTAEAALGDPVPVNGPPSFQARIGQALRLLHEADPHEYRMLRRRARLILFDPRRCPSDALACAYPTHGLICFGHPVETLPLAEVAATLVHESTHLAGYGEDGAQAAERAFLERLSTCPISHGGQQTGVSLEASCPSLY